MSDFTKSLSDMQKQVHKLAREKGWYDMPRTSLEIHMLIVSEIAEATEEVRNKTKPIYRTGPKYKGELIELADAVIRILDYCEYQGYDLGAAIEMKNEFNRTRSYRHGGKAA